MWDLRNQLQGSIDAPWRSSFDGGLKGHGPYSSLLYSSAPSASGPSQYPLGSRDYRYSLGHTIYPGVRFPLLRELGFRLAPHDIPAACMSVMSVVMEPREGDREVGGGDGHGGEDEDEDVEEYARAHPHTSQSGGGCEGDSGGRYIESAAGLGHVSQTAGEGVGEPEEHVDESEEEEAPGHEHASEPEEGLGRGGRRKSQKPRKPRRPYTVTCALRQTNWFESSLNWEDEDFRVIYRVSKRTFWGMVDILKKNPIFKSGGRKPQRPVHYQLGVFLMRYGIAGSHARHPKLMTSIGEGTVVLYCRRVIRAIREHGLECVVWPSEEGKEEIKKGFKKLCGLDNVIGSLDGTLCGLETKPRVAGDSYISRKKTLSVNVQAVVDHTGRFIAFQSGWAGSRPDTVLWTSMWVYEKRDEFFAKGEFLLADGGYPVSPYVLIPFSTKELRVDTRRRREFNYKISVARIVVEWAFGRLKARFPALKKMGAVRDISDVYRAIEAMMVVHNMCQDLGDVPYEVSRGSDDDEIGEEVNADLDEDEYEPVEEGEGYPNLLTAGRAFRLRCLDIICPP